MNNNPFPINLSNMFEEWKLERDEIAKLKWIESEKAGHDIGQFRAEWLWYTCHERSWKTVRAKIKAV